MKYWIAGTLAFLFILQLATIGNIVNLWDKAAREYALNNLVAEHRELRTVVDKLVKNTGANQPAKPPAAESLNGEAVLSTNFGEVNGVYHDVSGFLNGNRWAGGIAHFQDEVIMMSRRGEFSIVDPMTGEGRSLNINYENGHEAFMARVEELGAQVWDNWFRFHDVLFDYNGKGGRLYVTLNYWKPDESCYHFRLISTEVEDIRTSPVDHDDWKVLFDASPCLEYNENNLHYVGYQAGGRMAINNEGNLIFTVGDYSYDGLGDRPMLPQDVDADYGKVFELDLQGNDAPKILSWGNRNPQGLAIAEDGRIWSTEHGPQGGDELNVILRNNNYGWPHVTLGVNYGASDWPFNENRNHSDYVAPVYAWVPSVAPSQVIEVVGFWDAWENDLLVATLANESLRRLKVIDDRVVYDERIEIGQRIRDVVQIDDGSIVFLTDQSRLYALRPPIENADDEKEHFAMSESTLVVVNRCKECHSISPNSTDDSAPTLFGILGRDIASTEFSGYSDELLELDGVWSDEMLDKYLTDPAAFTPNSVMALNGQISSEAIRGEVIGYLSSLK